MQARLKVVQDNANLKQVKLLPVTLVGRSADCHLKIASSEVSRTHCRITVTDTQVLIEDLNSSNGTYVDQERIPTSQPIVLLPGAKLHIGPAAFIVDYTPPVNLETMPTTVIKSTDLPFLQGVAKPAAITIAAAAAAVETPAASAPVEPSTIDASSDPLQMERATDSPASPPVATMVPKDRPAPVPAAVPVATAPRVAPPVAKAVAKPMTAVPVPANPILPTNFSADQTVAMTSPGNETLAAAPSPKSQPAAVPVVTSQAAFDFLSASPAPSVNAFDFGVAAPTASQGVGSTAAAAPAKKSLFGLFGKKEKPASPAAASPATASLLPGQGRSGVPPAENAFDFFGEPAPVAANPVGVANPMSAVPLPPTPPAAPETDFVPGDEPAAAALPPAGDDPFAFLKG